MHSSPVCHFTTGLPRILVRLACVRRAASVRSEPGSNSQKLFHLQGPPFQYTLFTVFVSQLFNFQRASPMGEL